MRLDGPQGRSGQVRKISPLECMEGIEPATFRFVAQYLNHCAIAVPRIHSKISIKRDRACFRSEQVLVAGFSEQGIELSGYIKF